MSPAAPTHRQLRFLRALAQRTATTFATPCTRAQASEEIDRLLRLQRAPRAEPGGDCEGTCEYAPAVKIDEVTGFGASARWNREPATRAADRSVPRRELARYTVTGGPRVLVLARNADRLRLTDSPADGEGESYTIDDLSAHESAEPLKALVEDYLTRARELDEIPMSAAALERSLSTGPRDG